MSHPPPAGEPSTSVTDPYANSSVQDSMVEVPPPVGVPVSQAAHVLTLTAPFDGTEIQLGAPSAGPGGSGSNPGIRMRTANHIHLTAGEELTTIPLGAPGGEVSDAGVNGLSIYTAGQKFEHVAELVQIKYDEAEHKMVKGELIKEVVELATYQYDAELKITSGERTETVNGNWDAKINGTLDWKATGDMEFHAQCNNKWLIEGLKNKLVVGATNEVLVGGEAKQILGLGKEEMIIGAEMKVVLGGFVKVELAGGLEVAGGPVYEIKISKGHVHAEWKQATATKEELTAAVESTMKAMETKVGALKNETRGAIKLASGMVMRQMGANMKTTAATVHSVGVAVLK